ncbi:protein-disulfide reductase DsbD N-terminal domain-containing protein [bacterium]|nr:protein-disulfide reductase DsbD N-terminal domain-containing protein [bacterium]
MVCNRFKFFLYLFLLSSVFQVINFNLFAESALPFSLELGKKQSLNHNVQILAELNPNTVKNSRILKLLGRIDEGYYIYSVFPQGEFSPEPTQVFLDTPLLIPEGEINESETIRVDDEAFEQSLNVHQHDFWIEQKYRVLDSSKLTNLNIKGSLLYQICNKRICSLPLTKTFNISIR